MRDRTSDITANQLGLITRRQAVRAGVSDDAIRHRVRGGIWRRLRPGLFVVNGIPLTWEHEVLGAVLLAGQPAWASHYSAARLWGFTGLAEGPVEITVPLHKRVRLGGVRAHRSGTVSDNDLRAVGNVPALSAARTVVDLSSRLTLRALEAFVDDGLRRRVLSIAGLHAVAARLPTIAPGRSPKNVDAVLRDRIAGYHPGDSELELDIARIIVDAGLPEPERRVRVVIGTSTYFIDLAYPARKLAIEVDGFAFHHDRTTFDRDRRRQNDLVNAGWIVLRFTSRSTRSEIVTAVHTALFGRSSGA